MTDLYRRNGGAPASLPPIAYDDKGQAWTDLANSEEGRKATGFVAAPAQPNFDPATQTIAWDADAENWRVDDIPPPPQPEPQPRTLGKLEFIRLAQTAGGMTDQMLVEAQAHPMFAAFWIKFQMASSVERDDEITATALGALAQGGYLPEGPDAVLNAWPTSASLEKYS